MSVALIWLIGTLFLFGSSASAFDDVKLRTCVTGLAQDVITSASQNVNDTTKNSQVTHMIEDFVSTCLNVTQLGTPRALRILVPNTGIKGLMADTAAAFQRKYGIQVVFTEVSFFEVGQEVKQEVVQSIEAFNDGWIMDPSALGELADLDAFHDLNEFIPEDPSLHWNDISRFFRVVSAIYDNKVIGLPMDGDLFLMYYRRDLFERYNLAVPVTWEDMVALALRMNGTDTDGDGVGDLYGACFDIGLPVCKANFLLVAMVAPHLQYLGTQQGVFFDPPTLDPLVNNSAMSRALKHYTDLFRILKKEPTCSGSNLLFHSGQCLLTVNWGDEFKANALLGPNRTTATVGISRLPGASEVLDRATGQLVPCSGPSMCPYAEEVTLANGSRAWVNFSPYSAFGGWSGTVNKRTTPTYRKYAYLFYSMVTSPEGSWEEVLDPFSSIDPYRKSQLAVDDSNGQQASGLARWVAAGYDANATRAYLTAINSALESPNMVLDGRLKYAGVPYRLTYEFVLHNLTWQYEAAGRPTIQQSMDIMYSTMKQQVEDAGNLVPLRAQYCKLIGCDASQFQSQAGGGGDDSNGKTIALAVAIPVGVVLVAALVAALLLWRRKSHIGLLHGGVAAPKAGDDTTMLITDIQDSTTLWELHPEDVMDEALKLHHAVVRRAAAKHSGYESATEGDSFILAFHNAGDAVACALRIQQDLLSAAWPRSLAAYCDAPAVAEVWAAPSSQHGLMMSMMSVQEPVGGEGATGLQRNWNKPGAGEAAAGRSAAHRRRDGWWLRRLRDAHAASSSSRATTSSGATATSSSSAPPSGSLALAGGPGGSGPHPAASASAVLGGMMMLTDATPPASAPGGGGALRCGPEAPGGRGGRAVPAPAPHSLDFYDTFGKSSLPLPLDGPPMSSGATLPSGRMYAGQGSGALQQDGYMGMSLPTTMASGGFTSCPRIQDYVVSGWVVQRPAASGQGADALLGPMPPGQQQQQQGGKEPSLPNSGMLPKGGAPVFRGLRIRIGVHSGIPRDQDVTYNASEARYHYAGHGMQLARAIAGAAAGGQVLLSDAAFVQLRHSSKGRGGVLALHMGLHKLTDDDLPPQQLYQALTPPLMARLALLPSPKVKRVLAVGALDAPVGSVAVAFMQVVGAGILLSWDAALARAALEQYEEVAAAHMRTTLGGGYMVEATNGLILATFANAADALVASLSVVASMPQVEWDPSLLDHELCEELAVMGMDDGGALSRQVLFRGLRVKVGVDFGAVRAAINGATGRIAYRGRVMNRAARVANSASTGQVLCSVDAWQCALPTITNANLMVEGISLGRTALKGITEPVELYECHLQTAAPAPPPGPDRETAGSGGERARRSSISLPLMVRGGIPKNHNPSNAQQQSPLPCSALSPQTSTGHVAAAAAALSGFPPPSGSGTGDVVAATAAPASEPGAVTSSREGRELVGDAVRPHNAAAPQAAMFPGVRLTGSGTAERMITLGAAPTPLGSRPGSSLLLGMAAAMAAASSASAQHSSELAPGRAPPGRGTSGMIGIEISDA